MDNNGPSFDSTSARTPRQGSSGLKYRIELAIAQIKRFGRLLVFGFEVLVLSRLFEGRRQVSHSVSEALLKTKSVDVLPPELLVSRDGVREPIWTHGFSAVNAALFLNLRNADALSSVRYAIPGPPFRAIYLWDSAFIAQIWRWWDPSVAWDVLRSVIEARKDGRLQHFASEFSRSEFTQPPLIAWSIARLGDSVDAKQYRHWIETAYQPLRTYHAWLYKHRRLDNGLFAWAHPYESGVENAPRFSTRDERRLDNTRELAAPDFSTYVLLQCEALHDMAKALDEHDDAEGFESQAQALREAINAHLWDEDSGLYFDRHVRSGAYIKTATIASLLPLWAGVPDAAQAKRIVAHILDPQAFNSLAPLPSVALNDKAFERDMWRGPVWINTAYAVLAGLKRYGYHDEAAELSWRLCDVVYRTFAENGRFYEFYDPTAVGVAALHRKRGNRWKRISLGSGPVADFVGWTGLVNALALDAILGLQNTPQGWAIEPRFPKAAAGLQFNFVWPLHQLELEFKVGPEGQIEGELTRESARRGFRAVYGERVPLHSV